MSGAGITVCASDVRWLAAVEHMLTVVVVCLCRMSCMRVYVDKVRLRRITSCLLLPVLLVLLLLLPLRRNNDTGGARTTCHLHRVCCRL